MKPTTNKTSLQKAKNIIKYYDPYYKLNFRAQVNTSMQKQSIKNKFPPNIDIVSILDAFLKRNGFYDVRKRGRLDQIRVSLTFYSDLDFMKLFQDTILPYQKNILKHVKTLPTISHQPLIEQHLLPVGKSSSYYDITQKQLVFVKTYFSCIDQYFCLKTLAYFGCKLQKLNSAYIQKYYILKKWLYVHQNVEFPSKQQIQIMQLPNETARKQIRVCIVGINIPNIVMAHKLSKLGARVMIVEKNINRINQTKIGYFPDLIKQGIFIGNQCEGSSLKKILQYYTNFKIQTIKSHENKQQLSEFATESYSLYIEEALFSMLEEILSDDLNNGRKILFPELLYRTNSRNTAINQQRYYRNQLNKPSNQINPKLLQIIYEKYILFNKLRDQNVLTISDFRKIIDMYYNTTDSNNIINKSNKIKMGLQTLQSYISCDQTKQDKSILRQLIKNEQQKQNFLINLDAKFIHAQLQNKKWIVSLKDVNEEQIQYLQQFTHFVYGDQYSFQTAINKKNYILSDIQGMIVKQGFPILQQLSSHHQLHCLYRFSEKVAFRTSISNAYYCYYPSNSLYIAEFGAIHFNLFNNNTDVLSTMRFNKTMMPSIHLYRQIFNILMNFVLITPGKIIPQQLIQEATYFSFKDERFYENFIKAREQQKLYFSLPVIVSYGGRNILQAHIQANNKIFDEIIKDIEKNQNFYQIKVPVLPQQENKKQKNKYQAIINSEEEISHQKLRRMSKSRQSKSKNKSRSYRRSSRSSQMEQQEYSDYQNQHFSDIKHFLKNKSVQESLMVSQKKNRKSYYQQTDYQQKTHKDFFGLENTMIKYYIQCINTDAEKYRQVTNGIKISEDIFQMGINIQKIAQQMSYSFIYPNLYLYNLGYPSMMEELTRNKTTLSLANLNGLVSRREYYSLIGTKATTVYYQCILLIDNQIYYCMVDQVIFHNHAQRIQKQFVYYHTNPAILQQKFNQNLKNSNPQINFNQPFKPALLNSQSINFRPQHIFGAVISDLIRKQIATNNNLDTILMNKLQGKSIIAETCYMFYQSNPLIYVKRQIEQYLHYFLLNNQIKQYSIGDIFFGKMDPTFIFCEMIENFTQQPMDEQIEDIFNRFKKLRIKKKYPLQIRNNAKSKNIVISRMFINCQRQEQNFMKYYEISIKQNNQWLNCSCQTHSNQCDKFIFTNILKNCFFRFRSYEIIEYFKDLIYHEILECQNLKDQILAYFKMTRIRNLGPMQEQTVNFINGFKSRLQNQLTKQIDQNQLIQNYQLGNLKMIGNDIICLR